ncbi:arrestin domain-containing protein 3-like isoform X2 [Homarus americanus]|uniref:arrestin domain-containing protein 3-like isoform X2 n=1 Tax=Homarus americanus TaxID=6706 RepID=UPI001C496D8B|nr:arrestin domain-containing protein 3-like isoform X2 [Homarus americanus]XP_042206226.1 arrestin domain-containing protein 3-like isoform X2 [Homarus americanus]
MPSTIAIVFDNPSAVFFSGQAITGNVQVTCDKPKSCRGIEVKFRGFGKVHWTERRTSGSGDDRKTETRHYTSHESYYEMNYWVLGNGQSTSELPPGTHVFNFSFLLPKGIPSSFESHIGKVRHQCKAKMDIPWKVDKTCLRPYSVNTLYDLNIDPQAVLPIECTKHDYTCCWFCRSGPMSLVLRLDRSGFVPGEKMIINAECSNMTNVKINSTKAVIHQTITYHAEGSRKKEHRKVAELKRPEIKPGDDDIWSGVEMLIPALPPSHLEFCRIIDIDYEFKFEMDPSGCHTDMEYEAPIVIGSLPLKQYFSSFMSAPVMYPGQPPVAGFSPVPGQPPAPGFVPGQPGASGMPPAYPGQPPAPGYPGQPPAPGYPGQPPAPGYPGQPPAPGYPGQPPAPGYPGQPPYNPGQPGAPGIGFPGGVPVDPNATPFNPNVPAPAYPGPPAPSAPVFPGAQQYPGMPLPTYNQCMFGLTRYHEGDSDDENNDLNGTKFAPQYVSYSLVNSKHQQSGIGSMAVVGGLAAVGGMAVAGGMAAKAAHKRKGSSSSSSSSSSNSEHVTGDKVNLVK